MAKILLTNVTKTNEHSNFTRFVHALMHMCVHVCLQGFYVNRGFAVDN